MGARDFVNAAETATQLLEGIEAALGAANQHRLAVQRERSGRRRSFAAIAIGSAIGICGIIAGQV